MADASSGTCLGVYKALYAYAATGEDEVDMEEDQLVLLLERSDDDWAKIRVKAASQDLEGPEGLVPAAYIEKAQPLSVVKAAYDYAATAPGELSVTDGQVLHVHERPADDDWILVESKDPVSKDAAGNAIVGIGYVPANYVEEADGQDVAEPAPAASSGGIVIPDSPPRPKFTTPEDLVAASKAKSEPAAVSASSGANAKNDPIETWSVSQLDKKGKKKKGTLGVGNGAVFFASEADKTPVQKWQTATIASVSQDKSKHIKLDFQSGESLQFVSKEHADAIVRKLENSRALATGGSLPEGEPETDGITPRPSMDSLATAESYAIASPHNPRAVDAAKSVHFAAAPLEIPPRADTPEDDEGDETAYTNGHATNAQDGEAAVALYDFEGDAADELSVREGEALIVLDRSNDDWWKCRNARGTEGVVPAQYVDLEASDGETETAAPPAPPAPVPPPAPAGPGAAAAAAARSHASRAVEPEPTEDDSDDSEEERERERQERERKEKKEKDRRERREREEAERTARAEEEARVAAERKKAEEKKARAAASARESKRQQEADAARRREKEDAREEKRKSRSAVKSDDDEVSDDDLAEEARKLAIRKRVEKDNGGSARPSSTSSRQGPPPTGKTRVWHDRSGQFRVEAEFKGFENGKIRLHKLNGVTIEVPSEKMSPEDMKYIQKALGNSTADDDDEPIARIAQPSRASPVPARTSSRPSTSSRSDGPTKKHVDWFEFFLNAGCDMDDCSRYSAAFERDKIDETILPDMKADTLRALGLREGDIIRVMKSIEKRNWIARAKNDDPNVKEQLLADAAYAQQVQEALLLGKKPPPPPGPIPTRAKANPAPNIFTGPGGSLKDNTRRGRPTPAKSTSINVDENMLANASSQLGASPTTRTSSGAGNRTPSPNLLDISSAPSSAVSKPSGFDDDAWAVRPSSTNPTPAAPAVSVTPPVAPASAPPAPAPVVAQPPRPSTTSPTTAALSAELELLQKIAELKRPPSAPAPSLQIPAPPPVPSPSFTQAPSLQPQQTGFYGGATNGVRGPFAPVPANAPVLLQPLIPTNTGMVGYVPTRPGAGGAMAPRPLMTQATGFQMNSGGFQSQMSPFQPQVTGFQPQATGFQPQMTGFQQQPSPFQPQPTGFQGSMLSAQQTGYGMSGLSPLATQQTGMPFGYRSTPSPIPPVPSMPSQFTASPTYNQQSNFNPSPQPNFQNNNNFNTQPITTQPLSSLNFGGPPSASPPPANHAPANVFASMMSGNFGGDDHAAPNAPNYDALRANPGANQLTSQPTGWVPGFQYR